MTIFVAPRTRPVVYFNIPKSGCTTFKNWLYFMDHGEYPAEPNQIHELQKDKLLTYQSNRSAIYQKFQNSFVFTFVRHPLKRAYSFYNEKVASTEKYSFPEIRQIVIERYGANFKERSLEQERANFVATMHFVQDTITGRYNRAPDWHWTSQTTVINSAQHVRPLDFIGRIESIKDDIAFVQKKIGVDIPLPRFNEGESPRYAYDQILTDEIVDLCRLIYHDDLRNLAYSF